MHNEVILTRNNKKPIKVSLNDLFEEKDGRSNKIFTVTRIDVTNYATYITVTDYAGVKRAYGSSAFIKKYNPKGV